MIVSAASRMSSAISFGVFWRFAPSTSAIIRSRNVSPGLGRDADDDPVGEDPRAAGDRAPIAAALADDRRALAGDGALVDRGDALDHLAVGRDDLAGLDEHVVALAQRGAGTSSRAPRARRPREPDRRHVSPRAGAARPPAPCRAPRRSPRRSSRTAP